MEFISANGAGRYFFAGNCLYMLAILLMTQPLYARRTTRVLGLLLAGLWLRQVTPDIQGKPWLDAYHEAATTNSRTIQIWPEGRRMPRPARHGRAWLPEHDLN
jgi:hypothetical protein